MYNMTDIRILKKNDCINLKKANAYSSIHPLLNVHVYFSQSTAYNKNMCNVIPQIHISETQKMPLLQSTIEINTLMERDKYSSQSEEQVSKCLKDDGVKCIEPVLNFTLPINSNNFLEVVFNINTLNQLDEWINTFDFSKENINIVELVLDLFWINNYDKIDENLDIFIKLNQKIIKLIFDKDISIDLMSKIINRLMRHNYGKKIKYLRKIKKYLTKYI